MKRLEDKTVIVTGGTMGIGESIVRRCLDEGAGVVVVARNAERGERLLAELGGERLRFVAGDVADPATADAAVEAAEELGGVDVLVNNAAIDFTSDLLDTDPGDVRRVFEINVFGAFSMLTRVARELKARGGGSIVNVSSRLASIGVPTMVVYSASKGALLALTRGAAIELAPHNVRVNAVAPGLTATAALRRVDRRARRPRDLRGRDREVDPPGPGGHAGGGGGGRGVPGRRRVRPRDRRLDPDRRRLHRRLSLNPPIPAASRHRGRSPEPIGREPGG